MKKLHTQKQSLSTKLASYGRTVAQLENIGNQSSENDRLNYQNSLMIVGNNDLINKASKTLHHSQNFLPNEIITANNLEKKVNLLTK